MIFPRVFIVVIVKLNKLASVHYAVKPLKAALQNEGNVPVGGAKQEEALFSLVAIPR